MFEEATGREEQLEEAIILVASALEVSEIFVSSNFGTGDAEG